MSDTDRTSLSILPLLLLPITVLLAGCGGPDLFDRLMSPRWGFCGTVIIILDLVAIFDLVGDEGRTTLGKALWTLLIVFFPIGGVILYFLFGRE